MSATYDPDRIRGQLCAIRIERMFRLIHQKHRSDPLGAVPAPSRFGDPAGKYAVLIELSPDWWPSRTQVMDG